MRRVEQIMGMSISIDIKDCQDEAVFKAAFKRLRQIDDRFSTYKPDSEVTQFASGKLAEHDLSHELQQVIKACRDAEARTQGHFSAWAAGAFDPSGYVKGWAVSEAGEIIKQKGYGTFCVGAGGDILARSDSDFEWRIGIQDPRDKSKILDVLSISSGAICTSGNYERGDHIINPKTKKPAAGLLSVSVNGPDIIWADVLATACFVMGRQKAKDFINTQAGYRAIVV